MAGRPRKPTALKVLHGDFEKNPQRRNKLEPQPEVDVPECPSKLTVVGRNEWRRLCRELKQLGVISLAERASLEKYCEAYEREHECNNIVKKEGRFYQTENGPREHPASKAARNYHDQCVKLLTAFGLNPTARTRLAVNEKTEVNPDEKLFFG